MTLVRDVYGNPLPLIAGFDWCRSDREVDGEDAPILRSEDGCFGVAGEVYDDESPGLCLDEQTERGAYVMQVREDVIRSYLDGLAAWRLSHANGGELAAGIRARAGFREGDYAMTWVTPTKYVVGRVAKVYDRGDVCIVGVGDEGHKWTVPATACTKLHAPETQADVMPDVDPPEVPSPTDRWSWTCPHPREKIIRGFGGPTDRCTQCWAHIAWADMLPPVRILPGDGRWLHFPEESPPPATGEATGRSYIDGVAPFPACTDAEADDGGAAFDREGVTVPVRAPMIRTTMGDVEPCRRVVVTSTGRQFECQLPDGHDGRCCATTGGTP